MGASPPGTLRQWRARMRLTAPRKNSDRSYTCTRSIRIDLPKIDTIVQAISVLTAWELRFPLIITAPLRRLN